MKFIQRHSGRWLTHYTMLLRTCVWRYRCIPGGSLLYLPAVSKACEPALDTRSLNFLLDKEFDLYGMKGDSLSVINHLLTNPNKSQLRFNLMKSSALFQLERFELPMRNRWTRLIRGTDNSLAITESLRLLRYIRREELLRLANVAHKRGRSLYAGP
jgi:hypothetical protein